MPAHTVDAHLEHARHVARAAFDDHRSPDTDPVDSALDAYTRVLEDAGWLVVPGREPEPTLPTEAEIENVANWLAERVTHPRITGGQVLLDYPHNVEFAHAHAIRAHGASPSTLEGINTARDVLLNWHKRNARQ